jgi:hypothetical protein
VSVARVDELASWTNWCPLADAVEDPPNANKPGVYRVRHRESRNEFYVGCTHRRPVVHRLREYMAGRDLNGLGEAVLDLALNDEEWLQSRLDGVRKHKRMTAVEWAQAALEHADVEVSLSFTDPGEAARELESKTIDALPQEHLRNKVVVKKLAKEQGSRH